MTSECNQISSAQLEALLYEAEESAASTELALHIEQCETCQTRLVEILSQDGIEREASQLLSGYVGATQPDRHLTHSSNLVEPSPSDLDKDLDKVLLGAPSHPEMLGRLGRYEIERRIGAGGMGVVFKAIDTELNRTVAIKVLAPHLARNGAARQRFSRESRAAAAVVHEHVVSIHNVDSSGEYPYLVMQYVSGESLQSRVEREGPLSVERILRVGIQAALGLAAAHEQGIVHRDIKPANILLEDAVDRLLITDFGLARTVDDASLTHTGVVAGTPSYMSPEQATGDEVDHRTDLFSLGSVLYYAATGHPPFRAERTMGVLHRICHQQHRPVWQVNTAVPDELSDVIDRLLEKRRSKRFAGATAVAETLTRILHRLQHRRPGMLTRLTSWGRRNRPVAVSSAALLLVAIGLATWSVWWPTYPIAAKRVFDGSTVGQPSLGMADATSQESGVHGDLFMAVDSPSDHMQTRNSSLPSAMGNAVDTNLFPPTDRVEFDQSLNEVTQSLNSIESVGPVYETDSFSAYQQEVKWLEQTLQSIDPTIPPKKM